MASETPDASAVPNPTAGLMDDALGRMRATADRLRDDPDLRDYRTLTDLDPPELLRAGFRAVRAAKAAQIIEEIALDSLEQDLEDALLLLDRCRYAVPMNPAHADRLRVRREILERQVAEIRGLIAAERSRSERGGGTGRLSPLPSRSDGDEATRS